MKKYLLLLKNLTCAGCAAEIERELRAIDWIAGLSLDFLGRELTLFINRQIEEAELLSLINKIVKKIEPEVEVVLISGKEKEYRFRDSIADSFKTKEFLFSTSGFLLFIIAFFDFVPELRLMIYLVSYLIIGRDVIKGALRKLLSRYLFNEHFLMTVATLGAILIGEYAEAVAVMLFYQIGRFFESKIVEYSQHSIDELQRLKPEYANLIKENQTLKVLPEQVKIGDLIIVKPGERIPLDGIITEGTSSVNNSLITGESFPEAVGIGYKVNAGAVNLHSSLTVKVQSHYESSTISRIIELVRSAKSRKTRTERFITRFAAIYTPVVLALALLIALIPPFILSIGSFEAWFYRALIFLVISCPCALVISVPLSFFAGLAVLVRNGVLVKGGLFIENLAKTTIVILDKTGTLTMGKVVVKRLKPVSDVDEDYLLYNAYLVERRSNHPLALAVSAEYHRRLANHNEFRDKDTGSLTYEEFPGKGVKVIGDGLSVVAGNLDYLMTEGVSFSERMNLEWNNQTIIGVAGNGNFLGTIEFADTIRSKIPEMLNKIKSRGIKRVLMLTGDGWEIAGEIAAALGIKEFYANLLPEDKLRFMEDLKRESKEKILFIGDGINDAPAMALADTGMAMGGIGSSAAIESSDVVLQTDEIDRLPDIIHIAQQTLNNATQNIILALSIKGAFLILGSLGLITIWGAVFADVGVTILAVMNSLRLLRYRRSYH